MSICILSPNTNPPPKKIAGRFLLKYQIQENLKNHVFCLRFIFFVVFFQAILSILRDYDYAGDADDINDVCDYDYDDEYDEDGYDDEDDAYDDVYVDDDDDDDDNDDDDDDDNDGDDDDDDDDDDAADQDDHDDDYD